MGGAAGSSYRVRLADGTESTLTAGQLREIVSKPGTVGIVAEAGTAPPPGKAHKVDVEADHNKDGVTDAARVGVAAMSVPPPPAIGRMPNLKPAPIR